MCTSKYVLGDDSCGADTLCPLGDEEHALLFDWLVDIVAFVCAVGNVVVSYVVDLVLFQKFNSDDPRAVFNDFVDPFAMPDCLCTLLTAEDSQALPAMSLFVASDSNKQVDVWESRLGLFELAHVAACRMVSQFLLGSL